MVENGVGILSAISTDILRCAPRTTIWFYVVLPLTILEICNEMLRCNATTLLSSFIIFLNFESNNKENDLTQLEIIYSCSCALLHSCDMSLRKTLGLVYLYCGARLSIGTCVRVHA
jgi:hypothetical protein